MQAILDDPDKLKNVIKGELEYIREEYGDERRSPIEERLDLTTEDLIKPETKFLDLPKENILNILQSS